MAVTISADLVQAYGNTSYHVHRSTGSFTMRAGEYSAGLAALMEEHGARCAAFLTGDNPFSAHASACENRLARSRLYEALTRLGMAVFEGTGQGDDLSWPPEQSYLALGLDRTAASDLGRQFLQNAILWSGADATPQLVLLR